MSLKRHDVFISYANADKESIAAPLARALRNRGLSVWIDNNIELGDSLAAEIQRGIAHSRYAVLIISPAYLRRQWTLKELAAFLQTNKPLLPVLHQMSIEDLKKNASILSGYEFGFSKDGVRKLAAQICNKVRYRATADKVRPSQKNNRDKLAGRISTTDIYSAAAACHLTALYPDRRSAVDDIKELIQGASEKIFISATALWKDLPISEIRDTLQQKIKDDIDVKVLLLDPFRSAAVFRTLLESGSDEAKAIISFNRDLDDWSSDPFCFRPVFIGFETAFKLLRASPKLQSCVRFYSHTPSAWLVMVDGHVFYEPYTFGKQKDSVPGDCIGPQMPVFRFLRHNGSPYYILEDHFNKDWITSDVDAFHMQTKLTDRHKVIHEIFDRHGQWVRSIFGVLYERGGLGSDLHWDRRVFTRQKCATRTNIELTWSNGMNRCQIMALIEDFSYSGLRLKAF